MLDKLKKQYPQYKWRENDIDNVDDVYALLKDNTYYFETTGLTCSKQNCIDDINNFPPSINKNQKFYYGLYKEDSLVTIIDWLDGYPYEDTLWIGFLVFNVHYQQQGLGAKLIHSIKMNAKEAGYSKIMLAVYKDNEIALRFWQKQQFVVIETIDDEHKELYKMVCIL